MASFDPQQFGFDEPPPRPTTPPIRKGFVLVLMVLCLAALLVYGIPYVAEQSGYAWESGRSKAAVETLAKLEKAGVVDRAGGLFRLASTAISPAVVNIQAVKFRKDKDAPALRFGPGGLESFGIGSGVVIDRQRGFIVTNNHVISGADEITVRFSRGGERKARLVGADPKTDLAVLQVPGSLKVAAEWGDSDKLSAGDWVLAVGSPYMLDHTVTAGIISATGRNNLPLPGVDEGAYQDFLQTDAAINPGNSGGPLIDLNGRVIGINTAILTGSSLRGEEGLSSSGGFEGIGLAIPSSMARRVTDDLIKNGKVLRGFLGVGIMGVPPELAEKAKIADGRGALISSVQPGSPAAQAGLHPGDVVVALDGKEIGEPATLRNRTASIVPGTEVALDYIRAGEKRSIKLVVGELHDPNLEFNPFGFRVREIAVGNGGGLLVVEQVALGSFAARAGLRPGLAIVAVGKTEIHSLAEFEKLASEFTPAKGLPLRLRSRDGQTAEMVIGGPTTKD